MDTANMTAHQKRVREFMELAKQELPPRPTIPNDDVLHLRLMLLWEELLELTEEAGFTAVAGGMFGNGGQVVKDVLFEKTGEPDLVGMADGCADLSVVNVGTLLALGIADDPLLREVDHNNLAKFGPGHAIRHDGKLVKPPGHQPPDIAVVLAKLS